MTDLTTLNYKGVHLPVTSKSTKGFLGTSTANTIYGTSGHDTIRGGGGGDTLYGGPGDDLYYVNNYKDRVIENAGGGIDTVSSSGTFLLPDHVENLIVTAYGAHGEGNALANVVKGSTGNQSLDGGKGDDVLTGGAGEDVFMVRAGNGNDVISDFKGAGLENDKIRLPGTTLYTFDQVKAAMTQVGSDVVLRISGTETLTIRNTTVSSFKAQDFQLPLNYGSLTKTFGDEFNSIQLWNGTTGWRPDFGYGGYASKTAHTLVQNSELQLYVDPAFKGTSSQPLGINPFSVSDGILTITARRNTAAQEAAMWGYDYTSGLLTSKNMHSQQYGYFEIKAIMPKGAGFWPAFWLLPTNGAWPPELDVMEIVTRDPVQTHATMHSSATGSRVTTTSGHYVSDVTENWHTYGVKWTATDIVWYVDGVEIERAATPKDMHTPMYMLINLAIGGGWAGAPNSATPFPAQMKVDYVRAYSVGANPAPAPSPAPAPTPEPEPAPTTGSTIKGTSGHDYLKGGTANDRIEGYAGNDTLHGGTGADVMLGGDGDDTLYVDHAADAVSETTTGGFDTVITGSDWIVPDHVEIVKMAGSANIGVTSNGQDNWIYGNAGANRINGGGGKDWIDGGAGSDVLAGGAGHDSFWFEPGDGRDVIFDFAAGGPEDTLVFRNYQAKGLKPTLSQVGSDAVFSFANGDQVVLKNVSTGSLVKIDDWHWN